MTGSETYKRLAHGELCNMVVILVHVGCCAAHDALIKAIAVVLHISAHLHIFKVSDLLHFLSACCLHLTPSQLQA